MARTHTKAPRMHTSMLQTVRQLPLESRTTSYSTCTTGNSWKRFRTTGVERKHRTTQHTIKNKPEKRQHCEKTENKQNDSNRIPTAEDRDNSNNEPAETKKHYSTNNQASHKPTSFHPRSDLSMMTCGEVDSERLTSGMRASLLSAKPLPRPPRAKAARTSTG